MADPYMIIFPKLKNPYAQVLSYRLKGTPSDPGVCFDAFWG